MNNKTLLISLLVTLLVGSILGWFTRGCTIPNILSKEERKDSTYVETTQMQPVKKDSSFSFKVTKEKTQKRVDSLAVKDSLGQKANVVIRTSVVGDSINVAYELILQPLKFIQKTITEIIKPVPIYVDQPWYSNSWFWKFAIAASLFLLALFN